MVFPTQPVLKSQMLIHLETVLAVKAVVPGAPVDVAADISQGRRGGQPKEKVGIVVAREAPVEAEGAVVVAAHAAQARGEPQAAEIPAGCHRLPALAPGQ